MLQSCETLITKINEWQKAILELEELSDNFLNSGDGKLKPEIDAMRRKAKKLTEEYQKSAYPELPNGEKLFWVEKELLEELLESSNQISASENDIKDNHLNSIKLNSMDLSRLSKLDFSLFKNLKKFYAWYCKLKKIPKFNSLIKEIHLRSNHNIEIPADLSKLKNLEIFFAYDCGLKNLPKFNSSIKEITVTGNRIPVEEREKIKKEYLNAKIKF